MGIDRALLSFGGFCTAWLSALRGISASFGLIFPMGEAGMLDEAGKQLYLAAGQLPVSCANSKRAKCLLLSTGSSVRFAKKLPSHINIFTGFVFMLFLF